MLLIIEDVASIPRMIFDRDKVFKIQYHIRRDKKRKQYTFYCVSNSVVEARTEGRNYCRMKGWTLDSVRRIWEGEDYEMSQK